MWATVGAALKKIAVALLGNPKVLKTIGGIVLGLIIIIVMPVVAIVSIFNGDIEIDTNELQRMVVENLSAEEQAKLQFVEDTMYAIEREMKASGFSDPRVTEAQVLFTLSLYDYAQEADFVSKLVGCFASEQTDEQLIAAVNAAFGTAISAEEFSQVMGAIRSVYIDTSGYIDPCTKNNLDLVEWAKQAKLRGWGYVWGTYGEVLTRSYYNAKAEQYPDEVGGYADFIESNWLGGRTSDCNGLIKGYGWLNPDTHEIEYGTNGMPDIGADTMYANATEKGTIDTIPGDPRTGGVARRPYRHLYRGRQGHRGHGHQVRCGGNGACRPGLDTLAQGAVYHLSGYGNVLVGQRKAHLGYSVCQDWQSLRRRRAHGKSLCGERPAAGQPAGEL